jgi:hypothetical protein
MGTPHPDDIAVESFASHMKQKLAAKRLDGRHGWDNKDVLHGGISGEELSLMLRRHVEKGDPIDVANFCMMLYHRNEQIAGINQSTEESVMAEAQVEDLRVEKLIEDIVTELVNARTKFPGENVTFAALIEEVGELATATFGETRERVYQEAVQVAVMAMRMVLDGDHTFDDWRSNHGLDPLVAPVLKTNEIKGTRPFVSMNKRYHVSESHILTAEPLGVVATFNTLAETLEFMRKADYPTVYQDYFSTIKEDRKGHRTRMSDSSYYDEVCVTCGATDGHGDNGLNRKCPRPLIKEKP